jgi:hypothetical protein
MDLKQSIQSFQPQVAEAEWLVAKDLTSTQDAIATVAILVANSKRKYLGIVLQVVY